MAGDEQPPPKDASTAKDRLAQVSSHIAPNPPKRRRKKNADSDLPADYSDILGQIATLRKIASTPDTKNRGYVRQKAAGKLWVRERVEQLLDVGSFQEVGSVSGTVTWKKVGPTKEEPVDFVPSNNVQGFGRLRGRKIVFTADDFSIRAGHADGSLMEKTLYMEQLALALKIPIIKLVDGSSGGGSVTTIRSTGFSYIPPLPSFTQVVQQLNMGIPNLGAVLGPAIGLGAARVVACHFSVMAADIGSLFNSGPNIVKNATFEEGLSLNDLGGPAMHCTNGTIDNLAPDEAGCFEQVRTVLSYLPDCGTKLPPTVEPSDPIDLGLARFGGKPVGIVSLNCEVNAGALDALGSQKITRMLKFLDVFNLPLVQFIAWPSGVWGSLPLEGGIEVGHSFELKEIERKEGKAKRDERYAELANDYARLMNPVRTANHFGIEEIIDPRNTRPVVCEWVGHVYENLLPQRVMERVSGKLQPMFA
ncbi:hypothetical protein SNOG_12342 [Parastagonospora nodorum SN15]|uniref:Propionyl-CoA carboxylase beta chain, mitochondrial n=1 Tax=Phaeosphaeria nodorum (strain SN15 / ATCC MYA-4574 / FGSC 10173) TaxID=321614 RepID=Q0U7C2_PHANO|nr:hypothetical protein SNOG_12342 [Parastagonospora nodorum SN15]EAT80155.2 hypothetical protein SNOG_12342 [Parastagonospora nodorum SN15]